MFSFVIIFLFLSYSDISFLFLFSFLVFIKSYSKNIEINLIELLALLNKILTIIKYIYISFILSLQKELSKKIIY